MSDSTPTPPPENDPPPSSPPPTSEQPAAPAGGQYGSAQPGSGQQGGYGEPGPYPAAPGQGYGAPTGGVGQPADLLMRFLARLIDFILVGIVNVILSLIIGAITGLSMSGYGFSAGATFAASAVSAIISAALYLGYFTLMESRNGQTVGKMLLKLQTQGPSGGTPTTEEALKRNAWTGLGLLGIVPILGTIVGALVQLIAEIMIAVTVSQSPVNEGWHDKFAGGTKVLKIG